MGWKMGSKEEDEGSLNIKHLTSHKCLDKSMSKIPMRDHTSYSCPGSKNAHGLPT